MGRYLLAVQSGTSLTGPMRSLANPETHTTQNSAYPAIRLITTTSAKTLSPIASALESRSNRQMTLGKWHAK